jgi:hypothetical protein
MAYGDNLVSTTTDAFTTSINLSDWENGVAEWGDCVWVTGGVVEASATVTSSALTRIGEAYDNDQASQVIVGTMSSDAGNFIGAAVRMQAGGADASCYIGWARIDGDEYEVIEYDADRGGTSVDQTNDPGTEIPLASGKLLRLEAVGINLYLGSDASGSDVVKVTTSDDTLTSGSPGIGLRHWTGTATVTSWEGFNIGGAAPVITVPSGTFRLLKGTETSVPTGVGISGGDPGDIVMTVACTSGTVGVADAGTVQVANENTTSMTLTGTAAELTTLFAATSGGLTGITYTQAGQTDDIITFNAVDSGTNNSTQQQVSVEVCHGKVVANTQADLNAFFTGGNFTYTHNTAETVNLTMVSVDEAGFTDETTVTITVMGSASRPPQTAGLRKSAIIKADRRYGTTQRRRV